MHTKATVGADRPALRGPRTTMQCRNALVLVVMAFAVLCVAPVWADAVSLADALDNHTLVWTADGAAPWAGQIVVQHDGVDAAQSGAVADGQASVLRADVTGPITVSFCWKVSSQQDGDFLQLYVDDAQTAAISGETDWTRYTVAVGGGAHTLKWIYAKDAGGSAGSDCGWVDQVVINGRTCVDGRNASGIEDGSSWASAFTTIQAAVDAMAAAIAPATPGSAPFAPEVWVAEGTYTSTAAQVLLMKTGVDLYGGFAGTESTRAQRQWRQYPAFIDGQDARRGVLGADATIDGFTIQRGYVTGPLGFGAGMYNYGCSPTVRNCVFLHNRAVCVDDGYGGRLGGSGGAMYNTHSNIVVSECSFIGNSADNGGFAGAAATGPDPTGPPSSFTNCMFDSNGGHLGCALNIFDDPRDTTAFVRVTNCTFVRNGDSIVIWSSQSVFTNCVFWGNGGTAFPPTSLQSITALHCDFQHAYPEGEGNINADPLFTDPDNGDFSLRIGSPCIDTGTAAGAPATDILGIPRPQGAGFDMGAYEAIVQETGHIEGVQGGWFQETGPLALTAAAEYPGATFQWTKDGVAISGATSDTFQIDALAPADSGWYGCQLSGPGKYLFTLPPVYIQVVPVGSLPISPIAALLAAMAAVAYGIRKTLVLKAL